MSLIRACARRPLSDSALVAHALVVHLTVALLLRVIGLRRLTALLSRAQRPARPKGSPSSRRGSCASTMGDDAERRVVWAVRTATYLVPLGRTCLTEALTAQHLLRRHGGDAMLRFGVSMCKVSGAVQPPIAAHAWLEAAGRIIIGGETAALYEPLATRKEMS
jgi:hypothetical protein